jgi:hypothetical protein
MEAGEVQVCSVSVHKIEFNKFETTPPIPYRGMSRPSDGGEFVSCLCRIVLISAKNQKKRHASKKNVHKTPLKYV